MVQKASQWNQKYWKYTSHYLHVVRGKAVHFVYLSSGEPGQVDRDPPNPTPTTQVGRDPVPDLPSASPAPPLASGQVGWYPTPLLPLSLSPSPLPGRDPVLPPPLPRRTRGRTSHEGIPPEGPRSKKDQRKKALPPPPPPVYGLVQTDQQDWEE